MSSICGPCGLLLDVGTAALGGCLQILTVPGSSTLRPSCGSRGSRSLFTRSSSSAALIADSSEEICQLPLALVIVLAFG